MGDAHSFLRPSSGSFIPGTPSGLTPNTRSEAEAALTLNVAAQTDSAAPTTPLPTDENMPPGVDKTYELDDGLTEAQKAYRRPVGPIRTSSTNYEQALRESNQQSSVSSNMSSETVGGNITGETVKSPTSTTTPFPPPGQGVVPLQTGVGTSQAEALKRNRPHGLSLGALGRQQSWSEQDYKHAYSATLMGDTKGDPGYGSGTETAAGKVD